MHSPGLRRLIASSVPTPRASPVTATGILRSWDSRSATGRRRKLSWTLPSGRPRWLARITMAPWDSSARMVGNAAWIRLSSVIFPSSSGTLKSTRRKTRFPAASRSLMVSLFIVTSVVAWTRPLSRAASRPPGLACWCWLQTLGDELGQVGDAGAVAPLVVVPRQHLGKVAGAADDHGQGGVDDGRAGVALEVHRDERLVGDAEDVLERAGGGGAEGVVDRHGRGLVAQDDGEVDDAHGRGRDAQAEAVDLALELGDDERESLGGAGGRRDHVQAGRAGATGILVGDVEDLLVVGVTVDRVHHALFDPERIVEDLRERRQAVGGAAGVADDHVLRGVVHALVDAEDDGDVLALGRGADEDLLGAGSDVGAGLVGLGEAARRLDDDVDAEILPGQLGRIGDLQDLDGPAVDDDRVVGVGDGAVEVAIGGVVGEEERVHRNVHDVVDGYDFELGRALEDRLQRLPADAAETVDADANCHVYSSRSESRARINRSARRWTLADRRARQGRLDARSREGDNLPG